MTIAPALLLAALAALPPAAQPPATLAAPKRTAAARPVALPAASLPTVEGEILAIDHREHRLRLRTAGGELVLSFDRNTMILEPGGAATPLQLVPGSVVKAGRDGEARAAWVELRPPPSAPGSTP